MWSESIYYQVIIYYKLDYVAVYSQIKIVIWLKTCLQSWSQKSLNSWLTDGVHEAAELKLVECRMFNGGRIKELD